MPRDDWPIGVLRDKRIPDSVGRPKLDDEQNIFHIARLFKVTKLQAALFSVLIKRTEVIKDTLHQVIESRRKPNKEETDPKMVDVVICHLRQRLVPFGIEIETQWASGYYMTPEMRKKANLLLEQFVAKLNAPEPVNG
jgi:DNA-binding response OmpR family regulator